jgi:hypothetical protein
MTRPLNYALVREGNWISGTTQHDEKFIGFVQSMNEDGTVRVWVTQSDREAIVGTTILAKLVKVKMLTESGPTSPEEVKSLIELALGTHDKEWFEQLRAELAILSTAVTNSNGALTLTKIKNSRYGSTFN